MKIKSQNPTKEIVILNVFAVLISIMFHRMYSEILSMGFYLWLFIILWSYNIVCTIAYGRTFTFDKTGCTVSLWKYKKHYDWVEFECVRYYDYSKPRFRKLGLTGGIMFSKKPIELRRTSLNLYCFFHPLSCVYVTFINEKRSKGLTYRDAYTAPKEKFENKLRAWGVEVQYPNA